MANMLEVIVPLSHRASAASARRAAPAGARPVPTDPRWQGICAALADLRRQRRRTVRIVDADCACGTLLIAAARHARTLGFTAIEGRGLHKSPALIGRARAAAARLDDPAIGLSFEVAGDARALMSEADFPADILLSHDSAGASDWHATTASLRAAANLVIVDHPGRIAPAIAA